MKHLALTTLMVLNAWAGACDLAPSLDSLAALKLEKDWGPCPREWVSSPRTVTQCLTTSLSPAQVLEQFEGQNTPTPVVKGRSGWTEWQYPNPEMGEAFALNRVTLVRHGTGSLLVWQKDNGTRAAISAALIELYPLALSGKACLSGQVVFRPFLKSCGVVSVDRQEVPDAPPAALQLVFKQPVGREVRANVPYLYYWSTICPVVNLAPM